MRNKLLKHLSYNVRKDFYLCSFIQYISLEKLISMFESLDLESFYILGYDSIYYIESYFMLSIRADDIDYVSKKMFQVFRFKSRDKVGLSDKKNFLESLKDQNRSYKIGEKVLAPSVHRNYFGEISEIHPNNEFVIKYRFPINSNRVYAIKLPKHELMLPSHMMGSEE